MAEAASPVGTRGMHPQSEGVATGVVKEGLLDRGQEPGKTGMVLLVASRAVGTVLDRLQTGVRVRGQKGR